MKNNRNNAILRNMETCNDWLVDNRLSLHLGKTEAMICSTKQKTKNTESFKVRCGETTINTTARVKYLGVNLDNCLNGEGILDNIIKKCSGRIKFLYRQSTDLPKTLKKTLCQSLVQSHMEYGISSWYAAMPHTMRI